MNMVYRRSLVFASRAQLRSFGRPFLQHSIRAFAIAPTCHFTDEELGEALENSTDATLPILDQELRKRDPLNQLEILLNSYNAFRPPLWPRVQVAVQNIHTLKDVSKALDVAMSQYTCDKNLCRLLELRDILKQRLCGLLVDQLIQSPCKTKEMLTELMKTTSRFPDEMRLKMLERLVNELFQSDLAFLSQNALIFIMEGVPLTQDEEKMMAVLDHLSGVEARKFTKELLMGTSIHSLAPEVQNRMCELLR